MRWRALVRVRERICARVTVATMTALILVPGCRPRDKENRAQTVLSNTQSADTMGVLPTNVRSVNMREPTDLLENSTAAMSATQPGVFFTINDSGNDAVLFALDTAGNTRGRWRIRNATNVDWEAASLGPCVPATSAIAAANSCIFVGDVGDNAAIRQTAVLYQLREPMVGTEPPVAELQAEQLTFRYPDGPHDVESIYVAPDGTVYLITKRPLKSVSGALRQALVFVLPATTWGQHGTVTATLLDSLPIVPGTAARRRITDASLSFDARLLAVRTYGQVYIFATDSGTGRVINSVAPSVCNIENVEEKPGEGVTWLGTGPELLLTREGRNAPIKIITCPLPKR